MKIEILDYTQKPLTKIGTMASHCYDTELKDSGHARRIGESVIKEGHGRNLEFARVTIKFSGISARMARELYTHIGGSPTRLQASTRYITYKEFDYYEPRHRMTSEQIEVYDDLMEQIQEGYEKLKILGCKNDVAGYVLPLAMTTTVIWEGNVRTLINMFNQRLCTRALDEFRLAMIELRYELQELDDEWKWLSENEFVVKCIKQKGCFENKPCRVEFRK